MSGDSIDALEALLETIKDGKAASITWETSSGQVVDVGPSTHLRLSSSSIPFARTTPTRLARDRNTAEQRLPRNNPTTSPNLFLPLDTLVFALRDASDSNAQYLLAASKAMPGRFLNATQRPLVLAYLLQGKECPLLLSKEEAEQRVQLVGEAGESTTPPGTPPPDVQARYSKPTQATKRNYVANATDAAFVKRLRTSGLEVTLRTRAHAMRGTGLAADFSAARSSLAPLLTAAHNVAGASAARPAASGTSGAAPKKRRGDPIILLSNAPTALVALPNVVSLLGKAGLYVSPAEARAQAAGQGGFESGLVTLERPGALPGQKAQRFLVVDSVENLAKLSAGGTDAWSRVVAVFTTGQLWQFKEYRWSEPKELFRHVMGVYVRWNNEAKNPVVRDWNVTELLIDRHKRHTDRTIQAQFFRALDSWLARNKPEFLAPR